MSYLWGWDRAPSSPYMNRHLIAEDQAGCLSAGPAEQPCLVEPRPLGDEIEYGAHRRRIVEVGMSEQPDIGGAEQLVRR